MREFELCEDSEAVFVVQICGKFSPQIEKIHIFLKIFFEKFLRNCFSLTIGMCKRLIGEQWEIYL